MRTWRSVMEAGRPPGCPPAASSARQRSSCCRMAEESTNAATALYRLHGKVPRTDVPSWVGELNRPVSTGLTTSAFSLPVVAISSVCV